MHGLSARRTTTPIVALLLTALVVGVLFVVPTTPGSASATLSGKLVPKDATLFGSYVPPTGGYSKAKVQDAIRRREQQLGRLFDLSQEYYSWGKSFPTWRQEWDVAHGRIPVIAWAAAKTTSINSGQYDAYIRTTADAVKRLHAPIFLRWFSEMDGDYQAEKAVSPQAFINAWKRIQGIFAKRGATNVVWVWCPTSWGFEIGTAQSYYPGDAYVDWICADGFNWAPKRKGATWRSFESIFQAFYAFGTAHGKPLMVGETGTEEDPTNPARKAQWVNEARDAIKTRMPAIKAFLYFDMKRTHHSGVTYDWRMDTSAASMQAFTAMAQDPYFRWNREYRPDAQIRGRGKGFVGDDVYDGRQRAARRLRKKGRARFTILIENDGNISDAYVVAGTAAAKRLKARYSLGKRDITAEVNEGSFLTPQLEPGESLSIKLKLSTRRLRGAKGVGLRVTSGGDGKTQDAVKAKVRRGTKRR